MNGNMCIEGKQVRSGVRRSWADGTFCLTQAVSSMHTYLPFDGEPRLEIADSAPYVLSCTHSQPACAFILDIELAM